MKTAARRDIQWELQKHETHQVVERISGQTPADKLRAVKKLGLQRPPYQPGVASPSQSRSPSPQPEPKQSVPLPLPPPPPPQLEGMGVRKESVVKEEKRKKVKDVVVYDDEPVPMGHTAEHIHNPEPEWDERDPGLRRHRSTNNNYTARRKNDKQRCASTSPGRAHKTVQTKQEGGHHKRKDSFWASFVRDFAALEQEWAESQPLPKATASNTIPRASSSSPITKDTKLTPELLAKLTKPPPYSANKYRHADTAGKNPRHSESVLI
eukprot:TRINITY_DN2463_c0_g1_i2.p1 TRINITY_DN2463_c0_g1~~TRINITY_DN2463_c0_g1_i2.p1  ORF type:complete len:266 (+),score=36.79 TRINITY_DN2463_c0_g1_i2:1-798(+)